MYECMGERVSEREGERVRERVCVCVSEANMECVFPSACKHCRGRTSTWSSEIPVTENSAGGSPARSRLASSFFSDEFYGSFAVVGRHHPTVTWARALVLLFFCFVRDRLFSCRSASRRL